MPAGEQGGLLNDRERLVIETIGARADRLVALAQDLIRFDTTAGSESPRDEDRLQRFLAGLLADAGATVDLWVPDVSDVTMIRPVDTPSIIDGYPQLAATFAGGSTGRSLLLNGHVDVVTAEPVERWTSDPFEAVVRDDRLYGRGACDMKGGIACMAFAALVLADLGVRLRGALIVNTVTHEETTGFGAVAAAARGVRADSGIVTEPTNSEIWTSCRGELEIEIEAHGRPGHAALPQPDWREGGGVNAIEKLVPLIQALTGLRADWATRPDQQHRYLAPTTIVPSLISGGEWSISFPASCRLTCYIPYLPQLADENGLGSRVLGEVESCVARAAEMDPWLREHEPVVHLVGQTPPFELDESSPLIGVLAESSAAVGEPAAVRGTDGWFDAATFTLFANTPCLGFGPGALDVAHSIDEHVPVADLVRCSQALAVTAMRWCGVSGD